MITVTNGYRRLQITSVIQTSVLLHIMCCCSFWASVASQLLKSILVWVTWWPRSDPQPRSHWWFRWRAVAQLFKSVLLWVGGEAGASVIYMSWNGLLIHLYCSIVQSPLSFSCCFLSQSDVICSWRLFLWWGDLGRPCDMRLQGSSLFLFFKVDRKDVILNSCVMVHVDLLCYQ